MKKIGLMMLCATVLLSSSAFANASYDAKTPIIDGLAAASAETEQKAAPAAPKAEPAKKKETTAEAPAPTAPAPVAEAADASSEAAAQPVYRDGVYVAFGDAYSKGTEGAKVTIKDGKIAAVELMRTSPTLIDRDVRNNYVGLWSAYEPMKNSLLGLTREEAAGVDAVSGATRSCDGWKLAVDRAFVRALSVKPEGQVYFEGEHMGVDPLSQYMVFARYDQTRLLGVKVYPLSKSGSAIEEASLTAEQAKTVYTIANELLYKGLDAQPVKGYEAEFEAALNALWDAEQNARIATDNRFVDGYYSAYGEARDKGVERADIVIRNGRLVDVKLYRLGANLLDRGNTAYADVLTANAPMVQKLLANGSYIANWNDEVDAVSGATESAHSWNLAVHRAFAKALKTPMKAQWFNGTFAGVDNQSRVLVLTDIADDQVVSTAIHLFDAEGKLIKAEALTDAQRQFVDAMSAALTADGVNAAAVAGHAALSAQAKAAFGDALTNASTTQGNYKDGVFTAYGDASKNGTNRAIVTLRNGIIVNIDLARVGANLVDRGETAYADVVTGLPKLKTAIMNAATRDKVKEVDAISGATSSSDALKLAIDRAYKKAEISEPHRTAYFIGVHGGTNAEQSVYATVTVEMGLPVKMEVFYLDEAGKVIADDQLSADQLAVKAEIETPAAEGELHKYAYRPAAFGETEAIQAISAEVIEAVKDALENGGR